MALSSLANRSIVPSLRACPAPRAQATRLHSFKKPAFRQTKVFRSRIPTLAPVLSRCRQQTFVTSAAAQFAGENFTSETNKADNPLRIVFVSAEVGPWSKTGGLGDVVGGLPIALAQRGHNVLTIAPRYR